jgi:hypothetical protein
MMKRYLMLLLAITLVWAPMSYADSKPQAQTYSKDEILSAAEKFFGEGSKDLANVVEKAFKDHGRPNAYIAGNEVSAALGVGVRYGEGKLQTHWGASRKLYWQGPSLGFDAGANASKVFVLIYNLPSVDGIFQRYPGVEGSLYFVGGVGMTYMKAGDTTVAPIRFGAGWRQGVNIGYMDFTREKSLNPL